MIRKYRVATFSRKPDAYPPVHMIHGRREYPQLPRTSGEPTTSHHETATTSGEPAAHHRRTTRKHPEPAAQQRRTTQRHPEPAANPRRTIQRHPEPAATPRRSSGASPQTGGETRQNGRRYISVGGDAYDLWTQPSQNHALVVVALFVVAHDVACRAVVFGSELPSPSLVAVILTGSSGWSGCIRLTGIVIGSCCCSYLLVVAVALGCD